MTLTVDTPRTLVLIAVFRVPQWVLRWSGLCPGVGKTAGFPAAAEARTAPATAPGQARPWKQPEFKIQRFPLPPGLSLPQSRPQFHPLLWFQPPPPGPPWACLPSLRGAVTPCPGAPVPEHHAATFLPELCLPRSSERNPAPLSRKGTCRIGQGCSPRCGAAHSPASPGGSACPVPVPRHRVPPALLPPQPGRSETRIPASRSPSCPCRAAEAQVP